MIRLIRKWKDSVAKRANKPTGVALETLYKIDPDINPNRCEEALVRMGGSPKHGFIPARDSLFWDAGPCGATGEYDDVCDPELLDAYIDAGVDPAAVTFEHGYRKHDPAPYLIRLRYRQAPDSTNIPYPVVEVHTMDEALTRAREYLQWLDKQGEA